MQALAKFVHNEAVQTLHLCNSAVRGFDAWTCKACLVRVPMQCEDACTCMEPCKERCAFANLRSRATTLGLLKTCLVYVPMQCEDACFCKEACKQRCTCASLRFRATMPGLLKTCLVYVPMQCDDACICMEPCKERCTCASLRSRATMLGLARRASCMFRCSAKMPAFAWSRARNAALVQVCGSERRCSD